MLENFARDILRMIPGGNRLYVTGNGHLRQKDQENGHSRNPSGARNDRSHEQSYDCDLNHQKQPLHTTLTLHQPISDHGINDNQLHYSSTHLPLNTPLQIDQSQANPPCHFPLAPSGQAYITLPHYAGSSSNVFQVQQGQQLNYVRDPATLYSEKTHLNNHNQAYQLGQ